VRGAKLFQSEKIIFLVRKKVFPSQKNLSRW
jgi:hypothetical protein